MDKPSNTEYPKTVLTYEVIFSYPAVGIPRDVGDKNDAMYEAHQRFKNWFNLEIPDISLARFAYDVYEVTTVYELDRFGEEWTKSVDNKKL